MIHTKGFCAKRTKSTLIIFEKINFVRLKINKPSCPYLCRVKLHFWVQLSKSRLFTSFCSNKFR